MPNKNDIGSISDQQALVEKLIGVGPQLLKRPIPGGKTLLDQIGKTDMARVVYNWLRGCSNYTNVKLSLAKDPESMPLKVTKIASFEYKDNKPYWEREANGRRDLADRIANIINNRQFVYIEAKVDGLYLAEDSTKKFAPHVVVSEAMAKTEDYKGLQPGTRVPAPNWEPFIEFTPALKGRFSHISRQ